MIFVEFFFHCDHPGCDAHTYLPGDSIDMAFMGSVKVPSEMPTGWRKTNNDAMYCNEHGPMEGA